MDGGQNNQQTLKQRTRTELARAAMGHGDAVVHEDNAYQQLSGDIPFEAKGRYACCGASRETILLDMSALKLKEIFQDCFKKMVEELCLTEPNDVESQSNLEANTLEFDLKNPQLVLKYIVGYVTQQFPIKYIAADVEKKIAEEVKKVGTEHVIALELLVAGRLGLCRHQALLVGYLLKQLIHQTAADSDIKVYRFRTNLRQNQASATIHQRAFVPHAVIILKSSNDHLYLLDSTRRAQGAENGLAMDLHKLDASRRSLLARCYPNYDISYFIQEIFARYQVSHATATHLKGLL